MANEKRLIDAYKLEDLVRSNSARYHHVDDVIAAIAGQPTVDAVEVVHGRWKRTPVSSRLYCSICDKIPVCQVDTPYCPNCGAKMDGERGNSD